MPIRSFCVSGNSICCRAPPQPTTVGTDRHTSRTPYRPCCKRADRQHAAAVLGQRLDDFADRQADAEAGAALELDERRPGRLRLLEDLARQRRR